MSATGFVVLPGEAPVLAMATQGRSAALILQSEATAESVMMFEETVPAGTLVIHGEHDEVVPLAAVLDWARPQGLPVVVVPGGEHFFHGRLTLLSDIVIRSFRRTAAQI